MAPLYTLITFALPLLSLAALAPIEAQSKLQSIINSQSKASIAELEPLWSALPPITVAKALGIYKGGLFNGPPPLVNGSVPKAARDPINWWGKQIISDFSVNPLLANAPSDSSPDGRDVSIIFPYPRKDIAQARDVVHQGVASATIIYAKLPLLDYLRVVKEEEGELWLVGKSDLRGKAASPPYFYLKRQKEGGVKIDMEFRNPYPNNSGF